MFRVIRVGVAGNPEEISLSAAGGLEADELQIYMREYFDKATAIDTDRSRAAVEQALLQQGTDPSTVDARLLGQAGEIKVEIKTLAPPSKTNGFIGVSMYCDANAVAKHLSINERATGIARRCGYNETVLGDVFLSRVHDDESQEWRRLDFIVQDVAADAPWLAQASEVNRGRNMDAFTSSGTMANMAKGSAETSDVELSWTQTKEDVDVRVVIPAEYRAKDVKVLLKATHVQLGFPVALGPGKELELLQAAGGAELFSRVNVDESSWSIDGTGASRTLNISLSKGVEGLRWLTLTRRS